MPQAYPIAKRTSTRCRRHSASGIAAGRSDAHLQIRDRTAALASTAPGAAPCRQPGNAQGLVAFSNCGQCTARRRPPLDTPCALAAVHACQTQAKHERGYTYVLLETSLCCFSTLPYRATWCWLGIPRLPLCFSRRVTVQYSPCSCIHRDTCTVLPKETSPPQRGQPSMRLLFTRRHCQT